MLQVNAVFEKLRIKLCFEFLYMSASLEAVFLLIVTLTCEIQLLVEALLYVNLCVVQVELWCC